MRWLCCAGAVVLAACGGAPAQNSPPPASGAVVEADGNAEVTVLERPDEPPPTPGAEPQAKPTPEPREEPAQLSEEQVRQQYLYTLVTFLQEGWLPPPSPNGQERFVGVRIHVGPEGVLKRVEITQRSGDKALDESVLLQLGKLVGAQASIPEPPEAIRAEWYGQARGLMFSAK